MSSTLTTPSVSRSAPRDGRPEAPANAARLVINGKFLGAGLNGVHRTAAHYADALIARAGAAHGAEIVAPRAVPHDPAFPHLRARVAPGAFGTGQGWEMLSLPRIARGALLVNFCNLGPVLHGNSVVMIHDAQTFLFPEDFTGRQAAAYRALLPLIGRRARRVLTVSDFARRSLADHGVAPPGRIDVVRNGTDHILRVAPDPDILPRLGLSAGGYLLVIGSTKGYKNVGRVFDALRDAPVPGLRLVVAGGPAADAYRRAGMTPPPGAIFTGFVSDGALRALYAGARLFAFPSRTEGFGLPPVEAMHCGTPVVAASAGAMPEICGDGALLIDPEDTGAWRDALVRVAEDEALAADLRRRGAARAAGLGWRAAGDRLWSVLAPLLDTGARP
ncbi:D-inositol 3-phosphate glycosyltransferase [Roseivivax jejudonensis]|uniref:D-inositol 3-phosphate glycosyltransferase n=1 Tax=Roseivivax jejudonensis TaxID=1529041 RepID=A0A1X6ZJQ5_9RHOB|nr:glycosyltransferase family 1 protein [Roseivivax jejudonensis]SLN53613.1 D-inositol 3-phosphate glycosyltransferase [Roseivivax jejudonensis]